MENKSTRLSKAARMFNVGISTIVEFLAKKEIQIDSGPNTKISPEAFDFLAEEYSSDLSIKQKSEELSRKNLQESQESISVGDENKKEERKEEEVFIKDVSKIIGIELILNHLKLINTTVFAIGNEYSDIDMLNYAKHSFLVSNAPYELKAKHRVSKSNNESGFSEAVKIFMLK